MKSPVSFLIPTMLILILGSTASSLFAQANSRYAAWQMDETLEARRTEIFSTLKTGTTGSETEGLRKFFGDYYFARWTKPESVGQVQIYARDMIDKDFKDIPTGAAREYLLNTTFDTLRKMVSDVTITPTARYNAVLAIGQLVQREAASRNDKPVPYAEALKYLVGEYGNKQNPDFIRLGALLGILRHTILGIADAEMKDKTIPALYFDTIQSGKPTPDRPRDEQELIDWFRLRALEGLGALKSPGENGKVVDALTTIIENGQESVEIRCRAARVFGELDFQAAVTAGTAINFQRLGTMLITLTKSACDSELLTIEDLRAKDRAERGDSAVPVRMLGGGGNQADVGEAFAQLSPDKQLQVTAVVQRIKGGMADILYGIRGTRWGGSTTIGIVPMLPGDDPVAAKLNATTKAMSQFFKMLDEGPPDAPAAPGNDPPKPAATAGAKRAEDKQLKVNLTMIRDELQFFRTALNEIIAGGG